MTALRSRSSTPSRPRLSHVRSDGSVAMVDIAQKEITARRAVAEASIVMEPHVLRMIKAGAAKKGDVLVTAQIAGILAAKRTAQLIPLCHPIALSDIHIECETSGKDTVRVRCVAECRAQTGAEMEALTGAAVAALTIYDMCKAADRSMVIQGLALVEKSGGKSGHYRRQASARRTR